MSTTHTPFPPEFVSVLQGTVEETILASLKAMQAPEGLLELVRNLRLLGSYLAECEKNSTLAENFGIEEITLQSIRLVVECGGVFHDADGVTLPRDSVFSTKQKAEA